MGLCHGLVYGLGAMCVYFCIVAYHRLYRSPIAHIPGPRLAALTYCYEIYFEVICHGRYMWEIQRLHKIYGEQQCTLYKEVMYNDSEGPIIRVNPREVHISDPTFVDTIYSRTRPREKDIYHIDGLDAESSLAATKNHFQHHDRRGALNPFFSRKSVCKLEEVVHQKLDQLERTFEQHQRSGKPINLSDLYFGLSQDLIKQYAFGHDDDLVTDSVKAARARAEMATFLVNGKFMFWFGWTLRPILAILPRSFLANLRRTLFAFTQWRSTLRAEIQHLIDSGQLLRKGDPVQHNDRTIFFELLKNPRTSKQDCSTDRLEHEAVLLVAAGSESTAKSMTLVHFHLLSNPAILTALRGELQGIPLKASWADLEKLPLLCAIIQEGNRLNFGLTGRSCRVAPAEDLQYGEYEIPKGTPMSTMSIFVNANEKFYPDPWSFDPRRWLTPDQKTSHLPTMTFGRGSRDCVGKQLAMMELLLTVARVSRWHMELFETDSSDVELKHDFTVSFPNLCSQGVRVCVKV